MVWYETGWWYGMAERDWLVVWYGWERLVGGMVWLGETSWWYGMAGTDWYMWVQCDQYSVCSMEE